MNHSLLITNVIITSLQWSSYIICHSNIIIHQETINRSTFNLSQLHFQLSNLYHPSNSNRIFSYSFSFCFRIHINNLISFNSYNVIIIFKLIDQSEWSNSIESQVRLFDFVFLSIQSINSLFVTIKQTVCCTKPLSFSLQLLAMWV